MKASVIIPTRNRADVLASCLASLTRQTLPTDAFEVIVVDNGSTDHTRNVVEQYVDTLQLRRVGAPEPGLHVGRHAGMRHAQSDLLMFADDDIEAGPAWVAAVVEAFSDPNVALVGGNNLPLFEASPPEWLLRWWEEPVAHGRAMEQLSILDFGHGRFEIDPMYVWGCNFSVRRDVVEAASGFHPDAVPRDHLRFRGDGETHVSATIRDAGLSAMFDSRASVHHRVGVNRMTAEYFEQRSFAQGISDSYTSIRRSGGSREPHRDKFDRWLRQGRDSLDRGLKRLATGTATISSELDSVRATASAAYWRGYAYHQQEVRNDPKLLAWVLKGNYLQ